jgi:hypothetical protein
VGQVLAYSEELASRYVMQVYARAMFTGIHPVIWLEGVDEPWMEFSYGLLRPDLSKKQPYFSYKTMAEEVSGTAGVSARRDYPEDVEGYDFDMDGGVKTVLWVLGEHSVDQAFPLEAAGGTLRVVDRLGDEQLIEDGGAGDLDGEQDGAVVIALDADPRIVEDFTGKTPCDLYDFNDDGIIDLDDINTVIYNSIFVNAPYDPQYDIIPDGVVDIADIFEVALYFGTFCGVSS